jgi:3-mercaptopyruvate sulfurtransferase SseA
MFKKEENMKRLTKLTLALALGFGLILGGCATTAQTDMSAEEMVEDARKNICEITVAEAKESLDKGGYLFLDCREPKEYKMGHIPGAMNIPRGLLEFKIEKRFPTRTKTW